MSWLSLIYYHIVGFVTAKLMTFRDYSIFKFLTVSMKKFFHKSR